MWLSDVSVKRPVFAAVISMLLIAFGVLSFSELSVREYPNITPPIVSITTTYAGASAEVVETRITQRLEGEVSGIEGVKNISSSSRDGQSSINVEFGLDTDLESATNDIRDRISRVQRSLPDNVDIPSIRKQDSDAQPVMWISLSDTSGQRNAMQLTDYLERYVVDRFATISGVSNVPIFGAATPSMRIYLDRLALAARDLTVTDIENTLRRENIELPAGRLDSKDKEFTARIARDYQTVDDFQQLVIKRGEDGHLVRLVEVAEVKVGPRNDREMFRTNGISAPGIGITKISTANTVDVLDAVKSEMESINNDLPDGMRIFSSTDDSLFIREAISAVYWTIGITTSLVSLVILLFLGSFRAMIIPILTIPVCLISAFIIIAAFGYSINLVTLLALVLSIGLVVDDSIVVLENVHRRIETGEAPLLAAYNGTKQVSFAVLATTAVLISVFAPIMFLQDNIGRIFAELAVTISGAVIFSSVLALSLTPMLCSKLMQPVGEESQVIKIIDRLFERIAMLYEKVLRTLIQHSWLVILLVMGIAYACYLLYQEIPQEYAPKEDSGSFNYISSASEGTGIDKMIEIADAIEAPFKPYVESGLVERTFMRVPSFGGNTNSSFGGITMVPWSEREMAPDELMAIAMNAWSQIPEVRIFPFIRSGLSGRGGGRPVQFVIGGSSYEELALWRDRIIERATENPGLTRLDTDLKETQPQVLVNVDKNRAAELGISAETIGRTLSTMMSDQDVTTYIVDGEEYDVVLEAMAEQKATPDDMTSIYVRSERSGQLIPLSNLTSVENIAGPATLNRYNRLRAFTIGANLTEGYSIGEALEYLERIAEEELPESARIDYKGESLEYKESSGKIFFTIGIALLVVFLVLAAQFESFIHPLVIMMTVPLAMAGVLFGLYLTGYSINIYTQIGMVMLIGIAAKNGVLIVEFINQLRDQGIEFEQAIIEASHIRFRPVLMTTISTAMGSIPLMMADGAGAESRIILGVVIFSGVTVATVFTLFVVPVFYHLLAKGSGSPNAVSQKLDELKTQLG